jgi:hypothetical protein
MEAAQSAAATIGEEKVGRNLDGKLTPAVTFAVACEIILGLASECAAATPVQPPAMTFEIYNSSCLPGQCPAGVLPYNIYPVYSTGTATVDQLMQALNLIPSGQVANYPYPRTSQFRFYINPTGDGIPPGGSVKLTVPAFTQVVPQNDVDPKKPNQYADWWGGARLDIFAAPNAMHAPPVELTHNYQSPSQKVVPLPLGSVVPSFAKCTPSCDALVFFEDPAGLTDNAPSQTTEFTLAALDMAVPSDQPYGVNPHQVDYDISYVNNAFMPVAMEPYYNSDSEKGQIGYVGSIQSISFFQTAITNFLKAYPGYPDYVNYQGSVINKLPSPLAAMPTYTQPNPPTDLTPWPWKPFDTLNKQWDTCTGPNGTAAICADIRDVRDLFQANFVNCYGSGAPTGAQMRSQVYQWSPFNVSCTVEPGADNLNYHLLQNTPGYYDSTKAGACQPLTGTNCDYTKYQKVKTEYDLLHYWPGAPSPPDGTFDPWVVLVHGKDYLDATAYAYSVDDAVGNMNVPGDGLIIAIGGSTGLPNPNPATYPINVNYGYGKTDRVQFTKYGVCTETPDTDIKPSNPSFPIYRDPKTCVVSFLDNLNNTYFFTFTKEAPFTLGNPPPNAPIPDNFYDGIGCANNAPGSVGAAWCRTPATGTPVQHGVWAQTLRGTGGAGTDTSYAIAPAPDQSLH